MKTVYSVIKPVNRTTRRIVTMRTASIISTIIFLLTALATHGYECIIYLAAIGVMSHYYHKTRSGTQTNELRHCSFLLLISLLLYLTTPSYAILPNISLSLGINPIETETTMLEYFESGSVLHIKRNVYIVNSSDLHDVVNEVERSLLGRGMTVGNPALINVIVPIMLNDNFSAEYTRTYHRKDALGGVDQPFVAIAYWPNGMGVYYVVIASSSPSWKTSLFHRGFDRIN